MNNVEKLAELVPSVTLPSEVEFDPSLAEPTLGSVVFCAIYGQLNLVSLCRDRKKCQASVISVPFLWIEDDKFVRLTSCLFTIWIHSSQSVIVISRVDQRADWTFFSGLTSKSVIGMRCELRRADVFERSGADLAAIPHWKRCGWSQESWTWLEGWGCEWRRRRRFIDWKVNLDISLVNGRMQYIWPATLLLIFDFQGLENYWEKVKLLTKSGASGVRSGEVDWYR